MGKSIGEYINEQLEENNLAVQAKEYNKEMFNCIFEFLKTLQK